MRRLFFVAILFALFAFPALAQNPNPPANRRFQPLPDHWMTARRLTACATNRKAVFFFRSKLFSPGG